MFVRRPVERCSFGVDTSLTSLNWRQKLNCRTGLSYALPPLSRLSLQRDLALASGGWKTPQNLLDRLPPTIELDEAIKKQHQVSTPSLHCGRSCSTCAPCMLTVFLLTDRAAPPRPCRSRQPSTGRRSASPNRRQLCNANLHGHEFHAKRKGHAQQRAPEHPKALQILSGRQPGVEGTFVDVEFFWGFLVAGSSSSSPSPARSPPICRSCNHIHTIPSSQDSIRHNLTQNNFFKKTMRPDSEEGPCKVHDPSLVNLPPLPWLPMSAGPAAFNMTHLLLPTCACTTLSSLGRFLDARHEHPEH